MARLKAAFPKMEIHFFNLLAERLKENNFSGARLRDAINSIIDNFQYKELNIADVIKFDRKRKLYTYNEVCSMVTKGDASFKDFETVEVDGKVFRVMIKDKAT